MPGFKFAPENAIGRRDVAVNRAELSRGAIANPYPPY